MEAAECVLYVALEVVDQHPVVAGVGDRQAAVAVAGDLARERERPTSAQGNRREGRPDGEVRAVFEQLRDDAAERRSVAFPDAMATT